MRCLQRRRLVERRGRGRQRRRRCASARGRVSGGREWQRLFGLTGGGSVWQDDRDAAPRPGEAYAEEVDAGD